jgi:NADH dehydrogenase FAD-containing subunit
MTNSNTYVIGDNAATPFTGLAQTALHDALFVSRDIIARYQGLARTAYTASKPPVVVPVGEHWAIFEWYRIILTGRIASAIRRAADLVGYHDVLPVGLALGSWRAENIIEETCDVCLGNQKQSKRLARKR